VGRACLTADISPRGSVRTGCRARSERSPCAQTHPVDIASRHHRRGSAALDAWETEDGPFDDAELNAAAAALGITREAAA
jgi:hypothetical protein